MTAQKDQISEVEKLARLFANGLISDDEFCENVILRIVDSDQSMWSEMLSAVGPSGSEELRTYCERINLADRMPLSETLMAPGLPHEAKKEKIETLRAIYSRLSREILNIFHDAK